MVLHASLGSVTGLFGFINWVDNVNWSELATVRRFEN